MGTESLQTALLEQYRSPLDEQGYLPHIVPMAMKQDRVARVATEVLKPTTNSEIDFIPINANTSEGIVAFGAYRVESETGESRSIVTTQLDLMHHPGYSELIKSLGYERYTVTFDVPLEIIMHFINTSSTQDSFLANYASEDELDLIKLSLEQPNYIYDRLVESEEVIKAIYIPGWSADAGITRVGETIPMMHKALEGKLYGCIFPDTHGWGDILPNQSTAIDMAFALSDIMKISPMGQSIIPENWLTVPGGVLHSAMVLSELFANLKGAPILVEHSTGVRVGDHSLQFWDRNIREKTTVIAASRADSNSGALSPIQIALRGALKQIYSAQSGKDVSLVAYLGRLIKVLPSTGALDTTDAPKVLQALVEKTVQYVSTGNDFDPNIVKHILGVHTSQILNKPTLALLQMYFWTSMSLRRNVSIGDDAWSNELWLKTVLAHMNRNSSDKLGNGVEKYMIESSLSELKRKNLMGPLYSPSSNPYNIPLDVHRYIEIVTPDILVPNSHIVGIIPPNPNLEGVYSRLSLDHPRYAGHYAWLNEGLHMRSVVEAISKHGNSFGSSSEGLTPASTNYSKLFEEYERGLALIDANKRENRLTKGTSSMLTTGNL